MCLPIRHTDPELVDDMKIFHGLAAFLCTVIATACVGVTPEPPGTPGTSAGVDAASPSQASTPAPDSIALAHHDALEAYEAMWWAYADAATTSDWTSPRLAEHASGTALDTLVDGLRQAHADGVVARGRPELDPVVSEGEPAQAPTRITVTDCGDSTGWTRQRAADGQPVAEEPDHHRRIEAHVHQQDDGRWRVVRFAVHPVGTC